MAEARNLALAHDEVSDEDNRETPTSPAEDPDLFQDPVEIDFDAEEGGKKLRKHLMRERSGSLLRKFRKSLTSFECSVCCFDFEGTYGEIGRGFIECHHIRPIALLRPGERTKLSDLQAVCANCRRMMHKGSLLQAEDLKGHIDAVKRKSPDQKVA